MTARPFVALALALAAALPSARANEVKIPAEFRVKQLEQDLADLEAAMKVERGKTEAMVRKALSLEGELEAALAKLKAAEARIAELERLLAEALAKAKEGADRVVVLERNLGDEQAKAKAAAERVAQLEAELARAKERIAALEKRVAELEARVLELEKRVAQLDGRVAELAKENGGLKETVAANEGALAELRRRKAEADARVAEFRELLSRFKKLIDAGKLRVKIVDGRMVVELATDVLFGSGSASLSRDGRTAIVEVTAILAGIPDRKFQVEGHTDNVPIATAQYPSNWELASARAITVVKTMLGNGMPPERISAASYADVRPAVANDSPAGKKANRRIEIVLVPDMSSLPGFDELNQAATTP